MFEPTAIQSDPLYAISLPLVKKELIGEDIYLELDELIKIVSRVIVPSAKPTMAWFIVGAYVGKIRMDPVRDRGY